MHPLFFIILLACSQSGHLLDPPQHYLLHYLLHYSHSCSTCSRTHGVVHAENYRTKLCNLLPFCFGHFYLTFFIKHEMKMPSLPYFLQYFYPFFFFIFIFFFFYFFAAAAALTSHFSYSHSKDFSTAEVGHKSLKASGEICQRCLSF